MRKFLHLLFILIPVFMIVLLTSCKDFSKCIYLEKAGVYLLPSEDKSTFEVYGVKDYKRKTYEIPNEFEGKPIVALSFSAFQGCDNLESIVIPENVTKIGARAFQGVRKLRSVTLSEGLKEIATIAFWGCNSLTNITIPSTVETVSSEAFKDCMKLVEIYNLSSAKISVDDSCIIHTSLDEASILTKDENGYVFAKLNDKHYLMRYDGENSDIVLPVSYKYHNELVNYELFEYAFAWQDNINSVIVPEGVVKLSYDAFAHCSNLESVAILGAVTELSHSAFSYCSSLKKVTLPNGLKTIGSSAFYKCSSLKSITLPSSVTKIACEAFREAKLESINLSDELMYIDADAFAYCSFRSITIPRSVKQIESNAFYKTPLKDVYYLGTQEEWDSIYIFRNEALEQATIHYAR